MKTVIIITALSFAFVSAFPHEKIVGGQPATILSYPYQVSIRTLSNRHFCGGSIISNTWVLTAAHCLTGYTTGNIILFVGSSTLNSGGVSYSASKLISHPGYNKDSNINDIALIKIAGVITFSDNVKSIQLASEIPAAGANLTLTGWGLQAYPSTALPNVLQHIYLTAIDVNQCKSILSGFPVTSNHVCTVRGKGKGACQGDSGGPLVYNGAQVGVVSWGIPCAKGYPDIFTSVPSYLNWIITNTRS